ncbi:MAG: hypothetical protein AAF997_05740 [Myxococcota bacterium]
MRLACFCALSVALAFGCSDSDATGATGGAGATGGLAGSGGEGGDGGAGGGQVDVRRAFILYSPVPPCVEGVPSDYWISAVGDTDILNDVRGTSPDCEPFTLTDSSESIECSNDAPATDYTLELDDGEPVIVSGTFETCVGFYTLVGASEAPADLSPFLDVVIQPDTPCEPGAPSDYTVRVLVNSLPAPAENVSLGLDGCTGSLGEGTNTYTCTNDELGTAYLLSANEGDFQVQLSGVIETCGAAVFEGLQPRP